MTEVVGVVGADSAGQWRLERAVPSCPLIIEGGALFAQQPELGQFLDPLVA